MPRNRAPSIFRALATGHLRVVAKHCGRAENGSAQGSAQRTASGWRIPASGSFSRVPCPRGCLDDMTEERVAVERIEVEGATAILHVMRALGRATLTCSSVDRGGHVLADRTGLPVVVHAHLI